MGCSHLFLALLIALSIPLYGLSYAPSRVGIAPVHCVLGENGVLHVSSTGVPNSIALALDGKVALCLWGEAAILSSGRRVVLAPVYADTIEAEMRGKTTFLTSSLVAYYGTAYEEGRSYVEWRSKRLAVNGTSFMIVWRGSGTLVGSYNNSVLVAFVGSMRVNSSTQALERLRNIVALAPVTTIIDPRGAIEIYGVGMLYPRPDLGRVYDARAIASIAERSPVVFSIVVLRDRNSNSSIVFSGASIDLVRVGGRDYLKLSLGLVHRGNETSSLGMEAESYVLALVTKYPPDILAKLALEAVKHSTNPLIALQLLWRALGIGVNTARTVTVTVTSTKIIEKRLEPFEASAITMVSLIMGIAIGIVLTRYSMRSRST